MAIQSITQKKNIIILGAGFGGSACARTLEDIRRAHPTSFQDFNIVLIDKKNYYLYTPALYEIATTAADDATPLALKRAVGIPLEDIVAHTSIKFVQGNVTHVDLTSKNISLEDGTTIPYEYLVYAIGSEPTYFGIPGVKEHAISLKWLEDAIRIRAEVKRKYDTKLSGEKLTVVIGGAGPAGIEVAAELVGYIAKLNQKTRKTILYSPTIIDGGARVLPGFDDFTVKKATARLISLGVTIKCGFVITRADEKAVYTKSAPPAPSTAATPPQEHVPVEEVLPYDLFIWGGGVQASSIPSGDCLAKEKRGRIETNQCLTCAATGENLEITKNAFAIGDVACFIDGKTKRAMPGTAQVAVAEAKAVAYNIHQSIEGKPQAPFVPKSSYLFVIPVGGKYAIAKIGPLRFSGFSGWVFAQLVELYYFYSVTRNPAIIRRWWRDIKIFTRND
ncbi:MAG: FAD-dependent oxidoreductase [Candidatus Azambacteria bacterium]|nr:FAD-dependent oxidoreductase [Candidatus Azambacteria bacterium]